ncbi:MAG TPA: TolC family protein [Longimicrobium sp.]|nr:TolC family protein [Longimicrobium sp.]
MTHRGRTFRTRFPSSGRITIPLLAATIVAIAPADAAAQRRDPLAGYVREAVENNLALKQERFALERSEAAEREARGLALPTLAFDTRYSQTTGGLNLGDLVNPVYGALNQITGSSQFPTDVDARLPLAQETRLRLTQPLFAPAVREGRRVRQGLRDLQGAALAAATRQLAADVQTAYLGYARASRMVELYRATLPLLDENLRVSESLVRNGKATPDAVLRARAGRSETEQALAAAEEGAEAARRQFNFLVGRELEAPLEVHADSLFAAPVTVTVDEAVVRARQAREELAQTDAGIRAAEAGERLAKSASLPTVSLALDYGFQGDDYRPDADEDFAAASVVVQWSAFNGGQTAARRRQASAEAGLARARREEVARQVELQVRQAFHAAEVARAAIATAEDRVAAARRGWQIVARKYEEGMAPQIELLDARTTLTSAELNLIVTRYGYAARRVELERAAALRDLN